MHIISRLVDAAMIAAGVAGAQPTPQTHAQHETIVPHQAANEQQAGTSGDKCCCERMMSDMRKMMEMMHQHQGMDMMPKDAPQPDKDQVH